MANALIHEDTTMCMNAWANHEVTLHGDGSFCTNTWDINPFGSINADGTFSTDAWDKEPTWTAEKFQANDLTMEVDTQIHTATTTDEFAGMSDLHTRGEVIANDNEDTNVDLSILRIFQNYCLDARDSALEFTKDGEADGCLMQNKGLSRDVRNCRGLAFLDCWCPEGASNFK